jgi:hypothetical protein
MAKRRASERLSANSKSAGINLRRARSPDAPKITIVQGSATATELCGSRVALLAISLVMDASGVRRVTPTIQPRCRFYRTNESLPTPSLQASWSGLPRSRSPGCGPNFIYQQLDALRVLRQQVRRELLTESKKHKAWKLLCQIPSIGSIRAAMLLGIAQTPHRFRTKRQLWTTAV